MVSVYRIWGKKYSTVTSTVAVLAEWSAPSYGALIKVCESLMKPVMKSRSYLILFLRPSENKEKQKTSSITILTCASAEVVSYFLSALERLLGSTGNNIRFV